MPTKAQDRPIRVINDDTSDEEMREGHRIPNADPPKNEDARGGFGNRDGKQGFGSDTSGGATAVGVNENADSIAPPPDNIRSDFDNAAGRANQDMPDEDEDGDPAPRRSGPIDELDAHDYIKSIDEMSNPNSRVGMGQMEPRAIQPIIGTDTNAELNDPNATDTAIDQ